MNTRRIVWISTGIAAVFTVLGGAWIFSLPQASAVAAAPAIEPQEVQAMLAALQPPKRQRPLVAIIGINDATETTDYLMPYGILRRADVADVLLLATHPGRVKLYPALTVMPDATIADFDRDHPDGADYIVVPAMKRDDDPAALQWIRAQAAKGATVIGICAGAKVVAAAGLLDGKRATTHWWYLKELRDKHPTIRYVPNRRFIADGGVITTTGVSASMPMSLTLVEAIAGRERAETVARGLGLSHWDAQHASDAFKLTRPFALTVLRNLFAFWNREQLGIEVSAGMDEVSLALVADAWSRTYRSRALTFAASSDPQRTRGGVRIVPDKTTDRWPAGQLVAAFGDRAPAQALDDTLDHIESRYGARTRDVVAMQLEYPKRIGSDSRTASGL